MREGILGSVRLATAGDAQGVLAIYAPIVRETAISFELVPPTLDQMRNRIEGTLPTLPWLVAQSEAGIAGYAYASRHRERAAYQWSVDVSVYVAASCRHTGVGRSLYIPLLGILRELGYYSALAGIALPNPNSVGFHQAMGFQLVGVYRKIGYKLGAWRDVGWWQCPLRDHIDDPEPPRVLSELLPAISARLSAGDTGISSGH